MPENVGNEFIQKTYYSHLSLSPQKQGIPMPPIQLPFPPQARQIPLPDPADIQVPATDLRTAIDNRATLRHYSKDGITLQELSFLLWCTQGIKRITEKQITFRTVPSAGSRHAFETYLLLNNVQEVTPGLYRFAALENRLVEMNISGSISEEVTHACFDQSHILNSAATFIWTAVVDRMFWRYVERGYRYLLLDAGHVCQNLYLAAEAIQCGVCAIAAFEDEKLNKAIKVDGEKVFAVYAASLGKKQAV
jgi:SagB-type dehydrogenase family enzyme